MGLFKRARSFQGASRSDRSATRGLLHKSLEFIEKVLSQQQDQGQELESSTAQREPEEREEGAAARETAIEADWLQRLLARLDELEEGIEAPGQLFRLTKDRLGLNRAALLLYDPLHMVFAPWAACGFDQTTNHRLRIPLGANDAVNRLATGRLVLLRDPQQIQPFQPFFSFREFSTISNLLLVPFIHESKFMGLLLVAEAALKFDQNSLQDLTTLADRAARLFYRARERHLEGAKRGTPEQPESLRDSVRTVLGPCMKNGVPPVMIRINTAGLVGAVRKRNPYVDPFRLGQDIARVVFSLFQSLGSVFQVDRDRILIVITSAAEHLGPGDSDLLLHHLKATLGSLLPELSDHDQIDLDEQVRIPEPVLEEALTLLAEII
jgi:hypothetical protein